MKLYSPTTLATLLALTSSATFIGCGSDDSGSGTTATGGVPGAGGVPATGAVPGTGAGVATGGLPTGTGGGVATGGAPTGSGGGVATGGAPTGSGGTTDATGGTTGTGGVMTTGQCAPAGTYAILFEVGVKWDATLVLSAGSGNQQLKLLATRTYDAATGKVTDQARVCSLAIPGFQALTGAIKVTFPNTTFDTKAIVTTLLSTLTGSTSGSTFKSDPNAIVVGADLADPANAAWPKLRTDLKPRDDDGDSKPGITADGDNVPATLGSVYADKLYIGFRTVAAVAGKMDSCERSTGTIDLKSINQTIIGCHQKGGADCDDQQTDFVNNNAPVWSPSGTSKLVMVKLQDGATCDAVRSAAF